ncbi:MAG: OmpA family protein [Alphaproteobacteria bacterium]|nr:OmpA family protein [Alphaproteobacteria bacterium]
MKSLTALAIALGMILILNGPLAALPAAAQSAEEIKRLLTTLAPRHPAGSQTVIVVHRPVEIVTDQASVIVDYGYTADIEVQFEFDSARLTRAARRSLAALGRALESKELSGFDYLIAGHTDAKGEAAYNRALSYDRANAVRDYLVKRFVIDPRRLHVIGWGESRLKFPDEPYAAVNRRVEVTLVVPRSSAQKTRHGGSDTSTGIKITPRPGDAQTDQPETAPDAEGNTLAGELPPCPIGRPGDPRNPAADIDDFGPRPGIDCTPPEGSRVSITPEGKVIIDW